MALWGKTDADESKPKWAVRGTGVDPQNIFATADGLNTHPSAVAKMF